jgi:hypothetical protein
MLSTAGRSSAAAYWETERPREVAVSWAWDSSWAKRKDRVAYSLASHVPAKSSKKRRRVKITSCR